MSSKDFQQISDKQGEDNYRPQKQKMSIKLRLFYTLMITVMIVCTAYNVLSPNPQPYNYKQYVKNQTSNIIQLQQLEQLQKLPATEYSAKLSEISEISFNSTRLTNLPPLSKKALQRISYGQPRPKNSTLRAIVYQKAPIPANSICALVNGITIISAKTIESAKNLLAQPNVGKWIVFLGAVDQVSDRLLGGLSVPAVSRKQYKQVILDSDYDSINEMFAGCQTVSYLQNTFVVTQNNAKQIIESSQKLKQQKKQGYVGFVQSIKFNNEIKKFEDLQTVDLRQFKEQLFNQYMYIFDAKYLQTITPVNYAHYAKYSVEQMLITPILTITQKTSKLVPLKGDFYTYDEVYLQFKQFALSRIYKQKSTVGGNSYCFVSYPSLPSTLSLAQLQQYLTSISNIENKGISTRIVINLPFNPHQKSNLYDAYSLARQLKLKSSQSQSLSLSTIRFVIKYMKAPSSLAVYQAAHTYCPDNSIIISSRHNVIFDKNALRDLERNINQKAGFYYSGDYPKMDMILIGKKETKQRFNIDQFATQLGIIQIFKVQLMRMINLWALKASDEEFFQTQASFVLPMIQMTGTQLVARTPVIFRVGNSRSSTTAQISQLNSLKQQNKWKKLSNNIYNPIPYNSLTNLDLRRGNLESIPKIIHQAWLREEQIPKKLQQLQETIKTVNHDFKYMLWKRQNLTYYNFPMSYPLIARTLEYEWAYDKNMHKWVQALFSYEILFNNGGIYLSLNSQSKKSLQGFLKYEIFFSGYFAENGQYAPFTFGREIIGAKKHSYHLRFVLSQIITEQRMDYNLNVEAIAGGYALASAFRPDQIFLNVAFGFHLFNYNPKTNEQGKAKCNGQKIPCQYYNQAYVVIHAFQ